MIFLQGEAYADAVRLWPLPLTRAPETIENDPTRSSRSNGIPEVEHLGLDRKKEENVLHDSDVRFACVELSPGGSV